MAFSRIAFRSETGRRPSNQDVSVALDIRLADDLKGTVLIVADGMGGAAAGAVAARFAADAASSRAVGQLSGTTPDVSAVARIIREAFHDAHEAVVREAEANPDTAGMGTTLVAAVVFEDQFLVGNVGDSRAYLLDSADITQITKDHTAHQDMVDRGIWIPDHSGAAAASHALTRAIGDPLDPPEIDVFPPDGSYELQPGQILLLCSDGLRSGTNDDEIHEIICASDDLEMGAEILVRSAWRGGSADNITVLLFEYGELPRRPYRIDLPPPIPRRVRHASKRQTGMKIAAVMLFLAFLVLGTSAYCRWRIDRRDRKTEELLATGTAVPRIVHARGDGGKGITGSETGIHSWKPEIGSISDGIDSSSTLLTEPRRMTP